MNNLSVVLAAIILAGLACKLEAQVRPFHIFDNNMVLQRDKPVKVWGLAAPLEKVKIEFGGQVKSAVANQQGEWSVYLDPMRVNSQPGNMKVSGKNSSVQFTNVLVGDVWILGGQSNMEFDLARIFHGDAEILSANFPNIRLMTIPCSANLEPQKDFERINEYDGWYERYDKKGYWFLCSPETVPTFSGLGYIFGRRLYMASQVPIGLIDVSMGGTTVEAWLTPETLAEMPENSSLLKQWDDKVAAYDPEEDLRVKIKNWEKTSAARIKEGQEPEPKPGAPSPSPALDRNFPGSSYTGMVAVIAGLTVKGIVFHHGYNNALEDSRPKLYALNFKALIADWRKTFNDKELPFGIIEFSAGGEPQTLENFELRMIDPSASIREGQFKAFKDLPNTGFVCSYDQQVNWYHPQKKVEAGERMARWALSTQYGFNLEWEPAICNDIERLKDKIIITFSKEVKTSDDRPIEGFAIAGSDRHFFPAKAAYVKTKNEKGQPVDDKKRIEVSNNLTVDPVEVRYAWARNPLGNLVNSECPIIPVPLFRSDNWDYPEAPYLPDEYAAHRANLKLLRKQASELAQDRIIAETEMKVNERPVTLFPSSNQKAAFPFRDFDQLSNNQEIKLLGNRFFTFSTVVRVNQIEVSRDKNDGVDESGIHSPEAARTFRETIEKCWPGARITWTFSWLALKDQRSNYKEIRELVVSYHKKYGDEITFLPGGYFANMYNTREQVNRDLHEGLQMVSEMVGGGYRPKSVIAGFLSAENQRYLAEEEGIHVCQGNIWSQYAVDNGDGEGSISYPYYPSRQHFCKPAQGKDDFIDCVNLDGWTVDFLMARYAVPRYINGIRCGSRQGVGPIETILRQGVELGTKEILATTSAHFDTGFALNNFAWVTCIWELGLVDLEERDRKTRTGLDGLEIWLNEMRRRWPEAKCITHGEFGMLWREEFKNNDSINYRFVQRGSGVCGSEPELEIRWFMNKDFRLALLRNWQENTPEKLIDFTRYDLPAREPDDPKTGESTRNWSLMNRLNQKGTRDQDKPADFGQLSPDEQKMIKRWYPDLITSALPAGKPLKVFILAGQSNMQGSAHFRTFKAIGDDPETSSLLTMILDRNGDPVVCDNAWISYFTQMDGCDTVLTGKVKVGYGFDHERIGPEYAFSLWMDKAHDEPILIIKTAWGGKSLAVDFRPPGAGPYVPSLKEKEQGNVPPDDKVGYYYREMIRHVRATLNSPDSIQKVVPGYDPHQGYELAGFVWFQGWNDMCNRHHISQYTENMIHFIRDVRKEFDQPTLPFIVGILGVYGTDPDSRKFDKSLPFTDFRKAQFAAVEQYDRKVAADYRGNVNAVDSGPFYELALSDIYWKQRLTNEWKWQVKQGKMTRKEAGLERERYGFPKGGLTKEEQRTWDRCASNAEYHYLGSGKTFVRLGKAFAEAMLGMEKKN